LLNESDVVGVDIRRVLHVFHVSRVRCKNRQPHKKREGRGINTVGEDLERGMLPNETEVVGVGVDAEIAVG
jgi:hypothetical protein